MIGTPYIAVSITSAIGLLAYMNLSESGGDVFNWLLNVTAIAGFITWSCISISHLRFMKALAANGSSREILPYRAPLQPYLSYFGLFFCVLILLTNGFTAIINWSASDFFAAYISLILFVLLFVGHKVIMRTKPVKLADVDLMAERIEQYRTCVSNQQ
ncbi:Arginine permease CAN1 [Apiospora saccharicola]|uniref:Arginine permease CAN1 n=1 Tax=Apiospora saccharicola TaxID=335842 RepID=A0ABR1U555_9PEZI